VTAVDQHLDGIPPLARRFLDQIDTVPGWLSPKGVALFLTLNATRLSNEPLGGVVEFGVYSGRTLVLLALLEPDSPAVGFDIGPPLAADTAARAGAANVRVITADSSTLTPGAILDYLGGEAPRVVSVDGDHGEDLARNDLMLAEAIVADHGIVVADDFSHPLFPGVAVAVRDSIRRGVLSPCAFGGGRIALARPADAPAWRERITHYLSRDRAVPEGDLIEGQPVIRLFSHENLCAPSGPMEDRCLRIIEAACSNNEWSAAAIEDLLARLGDEHGMTRAQIKAVLIDVFGEDQVRIFVARERAANNGEGMY